MFAACSWSARQRVRLLISVIALVVAAGNASAQPDRFAKSFAELAKKTEPAVVSIDTKGKMPQAANRQVVPPSNGTDGTDMLDFLQRQIQQRPVNAIGSGFIVDKAGYIITNAHVVEDATRITVKLVSGEEFIAKVVGTDDQTDVAVLKINAPRDLPFLKFGDSEKCEVGDWVIAIGSPYNLAQTVTAGIISHNLRETPTSRFYKFIQTDAAINRGNSGGPLINMDGEVIGVNSQIATSTGDSNGIGFALPSRITENIYGQLLKNGKVRRGYLGAYLDSVKAEFASVYGLKDARGAIITRIGDSRSSAAIAGLKAGDVILEFDGQPVQSAQDLISKVAFTMPDQTVAIKYLRENGATLETKTVSTKLSERPTNRRPDDDADERRVLPMDGKKPEIKPFGLTLSDITPALAERYKLGDQKGLIVKEINPESYISDVRDSGGAIALGEGDLILRINRITVTDVKAFTDMVAKLKVGDAVVLHVIPYSPRAQNLELKIVQFTVR